MFFSLRELQQQITHQEETVLPLTPTTTTAVTGDVIDTGKIKIDGGVLYSDT